MAELPVVQGSVLILDGDEVRYAASSGPADVTTGVPNSPGTRFQIASISKQMTAAAVLLLAERGALTLDDPVNRWIGGCPPEWAPISLHHLLTHSSGLGHWPEHPMIDLTAPMEAADLLAIFQRVPLRFAPGSEWRYSSPGYVLLANVVQRAADVPYREFLAERVFTPLGMTATFAGSPPAGSQTAASILAGPQAAGPPPGPRAAGPPPGPGAGGDGTVARGHAGDELIPSFELDVTGMGTGDVWSTVGDLVAWIDGLRGGHLLTADSLRLMWTGQVATPHEGQSYGYGWFIGPLAGRQWRSHDGHNDGFKAFLGWAPETGRRVVILSNQDRTETSARLAHLALPR